MYLVDGILSEATTFQLSCLPSSSSSAENGPNITEMTDAQIYENILKTPEFLRLKGIKQLGVHSKYQREVDHNRYDHCIGVYQRAKWFLDILEKNSNVRISAIHKTCVKFAGLLHDVGHGPFSHFWEQIVEKCRCQSTSTEKYEHEKAGGIQVDKIFQKVLLSKNVMEHEYGVNLIKRLITGEKSNFQLRYDNEEFIFDIINNKTCNIDVDRLDYLHRDWNNTNIHIPDIDVELYLKHINLLFEGARISPNMKCVQFNREHTSYVNCMFELRQAFHEFIYQAIPVKILEDIMLRAICLRRNEESNNNTKIGDALLLVDADVEKWLSDTKDPTTQIYIKALNSFEKYVLISEQFKPGFTKVKIIYNYKLCETVKDGLYGDGSIDNLQMSYNFDRIIYYRIRKIS